MPTIPLIIIIRDYRYNTNITIPSIISPLPLTPPPAQAPQLIPLPVPASQEARLVKILPENQSRLPDAHEGETINITATVVCRASDGSISKPKDTAYLIVDGAIYDRKPTENGIVTFDWQATSVPINIHTICVQVNPSSACKSPGQDCKRITVSPTALSIADQLAKEKASTAEQKRLLDEARSQLRGSLIGAELQIPTPPGGTELIQYPSPTEIITSPITSPAPIPVTTIPPPIKESGDIQIIGLPAPLLPITPDLPIYVYIDENNVGRLYELPKTVSNISVGSHSVYIRAGNITSPVKTVYVKNNQTTTITL